MLVWHRHSTGQVCVPHMMQYVFSDHVSLTVNIKVLDSQWAHATIDVYDCEVLDG